MKNLPEKWEKWKNSDVGKEALLSVDREASMFMAFKAGVILAEREKDVR